jgi:hypothetical protein
MTATPGDFTSAAAKVAEDRRTKRTLTQLMQQNCLKAPDIV